MKLQKLRQAMRFSVQQLADKSGVAFTTIQDIESGERKPRMETAHKLETALGINGQFIDEFRPVLGEPTAALKQWTAERLVQSMKNAADAHGAPFITSAELRQRAAPSQEIA